MDKAREMDTSTFHLREIHWPVWIISSLNLQIKQQKYGLLLNKYIYEDEETYFKQMNFFSYHIDCFFWAIDQQNTCMKDTQKWLKRRTRFEESKGQKKMTKKEKSHHLRSKERNLGKKIKKIRMTIQNLRFPSPVVFGRWPFFLLAAEEIQERQEWKIKMEQ